MKKNMKKIYMSITESLCYTAEISTTWQASCTSMKFKKRKKSHRKDELTCPHQTLSWSQSQARAFRTGGF